LLGEAVQGTRRRARLIWSRDGRLMHEQPLDPQGLPHGIEIERDDSGAAVWCATWVHGSMHGPVMHFDERGVPVLVTLFVRGRGTDLWMNCGQVSEVRELVDGVPHGVVRWGHPRAPSEEGHFVRGRRHGIFREWESDGTLRKGFPRFYLDDTRVSRRAYEAAQTADSSLRPYDAREDSNERVTPPAVRDAFARARSLRRELALVDRAHGARGLAVAKPGRRDREHRNPGNDEQASVHRLVRACADLLTDHHRTSALRVQRGGT
jgi:hypothetical protein